MKILAILVTYYPSIEDVSANILSFIDYIDKLIIWENTPHNYNEKFKLNLFRNKDKVIFMGKGKNMGLAFAFNRAYDFMFHNSNQYTHLLLMDQDSKWINFKDFYNAINNLPQDAIYTPNVNYELEQGHGILKVKTCINSGTIIPIEVLKIIGKFNEIYSVDCVDYDFCFKASRRNINIYKLSECNLNQIYGKPINSKYFHLTTNIYSPKRLFFIVRNHLL